MDTDASRFIHMFHLFNKHTLCAHRVPGAQSAAHTEIKKKQPFPTRIPQSNRKDCTGVATEEFVRDLGTLGIVRCMAETSGV